MRIARHLTDEMVRHALDDRPDECCGLIGGKGDRAETVYRASNAEASPFRYSIAPSEQLELLNRLDDAGEDLLAIYHSHTKTEAFPSQTDVNLASGWPDATWVIISLKDPERPEVRAFRIQAEQIEDVDLEIS